MSTDITTGTELNSTKKRERKKKARTLTDPIISQSIAMRKSMHDGIAAVSRLDEPDEEVNISKYVRIAVTLYLDSRNVIAANPAPTPNDGYKSLREILGA